MIALYKNKSNYPEEYLNYFYDFVRDNYQMKVETIVIVHGIGLGILRKATQEVLRKNKYVDTFKIDNFNIGQTIVKLKKH